MLSERQKLELHQKLVLAKKIGASNDGQFSNILRGLYGDDQTIPSKRELQTAFKDPFFGGEIEVFTRLYYTKDKDYEKLAQHQIFDNAVELCDRKIKPLIFHKLLVAMTAGELLYQIRIKRYSKRKVIDLLRSDKNLEEWFGKVWCLAVPEMYYKEIEAFKQLKVEKWNDKNDMIQIFDNLQKNMADIEEKLEKARG